MSQFYTSTQDISTITCKLERITLGEGTPSKNKLFLMPLGPWVAYLPSPEGVHRWRGATQGHGSSMPCCRAGSRGAQLCLLDNPSTWAQPRWYFKFTFLKSHFLKFSGKEKQKQKATGEKKYSTVFQRNIHTIELWLIPFVKCQREGLMTSLSFKQMWDNN